LAILVLDIDQAKENTPLARTTKKILSWLWVVLALMTRIITFDIFRQALWGLQLPRRSLGSAPGDAITIAQKEGKMHFNLLVKAEAIVVVCTITLGVLQILIPAWIDYHKTIVFFLLCFVFVDFALFRILALVASEIRHRDQKSNYIDVMSFRVKLAGCSAFIIQCSVAAIFIIAWKSGHSYIFATSNAKYTCNPLSFLRHIFIPLFTLSFLLMNMAISKVDMRIVCYDHASNCRRCADYMERIGDLWQNSGYHSVFSGGIHSLRVSKNQAEMNPWSALDVSLNVGDSGAMIIPLEFISVEPNPVAAGGFGQVHLGKFAGNKVAVKKVFSQMLDGSLDELRHEIQILSMLQGFPHIVLLHGVSYLEYQQETVLLIVLEYCPVSLVAFLSPSSRRETSMNPTLFLAVAKQLANALQILHFKGFVHLDIKPENILFSNPEDLSSSLRIVDLGTASMVDSEGTCLVKDNLEKMSPIYAPPEAISAVGMLNAVTMSKTSEPVSHQDTFDGRCFDIYSLAITLWALWYQQAVPDLTCQVECQVAESWPVAEADVIQNSVLMQLHKTKLGWRPDVTRISEQLGLMPEPLASLVSQSWSHLPEERPRAGDIVHKLSTPGITSSIQEANDTFTRFQSQGSHCFETTLRGSGRETSETFVPSPLRVKDATSTF
jgi:serine/threonine protein kinase